MTDDFTVLNSAKAMMVASNEKVTYFGTSESGSKNESLGELFGSSLSFTVGT